MKESGSAAGVGELEVTPVSAAIARHLGIDLSPEGKAARNRRGIVCIVHGAPTSGETVTVMAHLGFIYIRAKENAKTMSLLTCCIVSDLRIYTTAIAVATNIKEKNRFRFNINEH